jgi:hypothetical protein
MRTNRHFFPLWKPATLQHRQQSWLLLKCVLLCRAVLCRAVLCCAVLCCRLVELNQEGCASEEITAQVEKLTKEVVSGHVAGGASFLNSCEEFGWSQELQVLHGTQGLYTHGQQSSLL